MVSSVARLFGFKLFVARLLLTSGLATGLLSWTESVGHIGNANFLVPAYPLGATHSWYHVFREACGDVAKVTVLLLVFFGPVRWRTRFTWTISLLLMLGYYAPFWIGEPFLTELSAPNRTASLVHFVMAALAFAALALAYPAFAAETACTDDHASSNTEHTGDNA